MALWKDQYGREQSTPEPAPEKPAVTPANFEPVRAPTASANPGRVVATVPAGGTSASSASDASVKESVLAAGLTIEGKIEGQGNVRVAGSFKGDVHVQGNLTIEQGAKITGSVKANTVVIAGELEGNVESATRVELQQTGIVNGDVKAGSLTVAAGSRMRGRAEFGWDEKGGK